MIYLYHERWSEAVEEFLKVSKLRQNGTAQTHSNFHLAEAYIGQGNTDAAIEIYKTALLHSNPENGSDYDEALRGLAEIYRNLGDHASAVPYYERYLELDQTDEAENGPSVEPISEYEQEMIDYIAAHKN